MKNHDRKLIMKLTYIFIIINCAQCRQAFIVMIDLINKMANRANKLWEHSWDDLQAISPEILII